MDDVTVHETAVVSPQASIGPGTKVWHGAHIREQCRLGTNCVVGQNVYIDAGVVVGHYVKIQNNSSLYRPLVVEDRVFIGPHVIFTNDRLPRSVTPRGDLKTDQDWEALETLVCQGASIGAGAIVLPGLTVGPWAMVGAASVVTHDVQERAIVVGNPARLVGHVCDCGGRLLREEALYRCPSCGRRFTLQPP